MNETHDDAPWIECMDGFDEKVLEIGTKFMEKYDGALKQLAEIERQELIDTPKPLIMPYNNPTTKGTQK
jgi:hypothetical protein